MKRGELLSSVPPLKSFFLKLYHGAIIIMMIALVSYSALLLLLLHL